MCKLCKTKSVYEFTNKRKLCKTCFLHYFQKKVLYTIRKFGMIKKGDVVLHKKKNGFRDVVLNDVLIFVSDKFDFHLIYSNKSRAKRGKFRSVKFALDSSIDSEADGIIKTLILSNVSELKKFLPVCKNVIKPLYLFLDEEILLYAKLKNLKFKEKKSKKDKIKSFEDDFEKKHPEVKRAIVNSLLALHQNNK